jgi:hypothetical protein
MSSASASPSPPPSTKRKWQRSEKGMIVTCAVLGVLAVAGFIAYQRTNANVTISIPTPTLPSPNAYDFYVKAGTKTAFGNIVTVRTPSPYTLSEKQKALTANAGNLMTFRQGMQHPYLNPPIRSMNFHFTDYAHLRGLARLLNFEAQVRAEEKNWDSSANSCLDALYMAQDIPRGGGSISLLVATACEAIGRRPAFRAADNVSAAGAHSAVKRLEAMALRRAPFTDTLQEEKWQMQAQLLEMFKTMNLTQTLKTVAAKRKPGQSVNWQMVKDDLNQQWSLVRFGKAQILKSNAAYMDSLAEIAKEPYHNHRPLPPLPPDAINKLMLWDGAYEMRLKDLDAQMQNNLLTAAFALRAYRLEKGTYPATLEELVSAGYVQRLPTDPFAPTPDTALRYRRLPNNKYLLYSVGSDGKDDGGKPILRTAGKPTFGVEKNDKGDFVKGINTYP